MPRIILGTKLYSIQDIMELLQVTGQTVGKYIKEGKLEATIIGKRKFVAEENLKAFLLGKTDKKSEEYME